MRRRTPCNTLLIAAMFGVFTGFAASPALAQAKHRGNWRTPEARSCAEYVEDKFNRRVLDRYDSRKDSERVVEITFHGVAQLPHLFGGNKHVSMEVLEFILEGDEVIDSRRIQNASYCVLDERNRVLSLEREMR